MQGFGPNPRTNLHHLLEQILNKPYSNDAERRLETRSAVEQRPADDATPCPRPTGKLSRAARRLPLLVVPVGQEKTLNVAHCDGHGQSDMMTPILSVLGGGDAVAGVGTASRGLEPLKKIIKRLCESGKKTLAVPLPDHVRGRLEREEAYKVASEEVSAR